MRNHRFAFHMSHGYTDNILTVDRGLNSLGIHRFKDILI